MATRTGHRAGSSSSLSLTPGMRLGLEFLRLSPLELLERIRKESAINPLLLVDDGDGPGFSPRLSGESQGAGPSRDALPSDLLRQISAMNVSAEVRSVVRYLCGNLDDRGYLGFSRAEIAFDLRCDLEIVDEALQALRACNPAGVGARSLRDCFALQLQRRGFAEERSYQIVGGLEPLMAADWPAAREIMGGTDAELIGLAVIVRGLTPEPGRASVPSMPQPVLLPDLRVGATGDGKVSVSLVQDWMPRLSCDTDQIHSVKAGPGPTCPETMFEAAQALIRAIEYRGHTMRRVGQAICEAQHHFFTGRSSFPEPLSRQDIAAPLALHPSTIGRAVRGRAIEFDGQVIPLERFFPSAVGGEGASAVPVTRVCHSIRRLVSAETADAILSDDEIALKLKEEGVDIKRRSVAKYRKCMSIPSSHIRKRTLRQRGDP